MCRDRRVRSRGLLLAVAVSVGVVSFAAFGQTGGSASGSVGARRSAPLSFERGFHLWSLGGAENLREAMKLMEQSREEDPNEDGLLVRVEGVYFAPYIPSYYLAVASCALGRCDEAMLAANPVLQRIAAAKVLRKERLRSCVSSCAAPSSASRDDP